MKDLLDPPSLTQVTSKRRRRGTASRARRFNRVLVPIDFSRPSLQAIPYALAISRQFGADVHLLHVTDLSQLPPPTLMTLPLVPQAEWNRRFMKQLQAVALKYRTDGNVSALEPRTGTAYEEICAAARELKADLIVISTHGYTGYKRAFLGSTAERVVQHSPCPVLVVRQQPFAAGPPEATLTGRKGALSIRAPERAFDSGRSLCRQIFPNVHASDLIMDFNSPAISARNCAWCM